MNVDVRTRLNKQLRNKQNHFWIEFFSRSQHIMLSIKWIQWLVPAQSVCYQRLQPKKGEKRKLSDQFGEQ